MNKTISANISGFIFNIEEDAYQKLLSYLDSIKSFFDSAESGEEIVTDIEARIAELFQEKLSDNKQVITSKDVDEVITVMGKPEQYETADDDDERQSESKSKSKSTKQKERPINENRKIYRDPDDRLLGGVCAGLSHSIGWDPLVLRLIFALIVIFGGVGVLIYILLWIVIPEAKTTAEKLQMKGKSVNVENISKKVNQEMDNVKTGLTNVADSTKRATAKVSESTRNAAGGLEDILKTLGRIFLKFIGVLIFLTGVFMLIGTVASWVALDTWVFRDDMTWGMFDKLVLSDFASAPLASIGIILTIGSVITLLIWIGLKIILDIKTRVRGLGLALFAMFMLGVIMLAITGLNIGRNFGWDEDIKDEVSFAIAPTDTLFVNVGYDDIFNNKYKSDYDDAPFGLMREQDGKLFMGSATRMYFMHIDSGDVRVKTVRQACGSSRLRATEYAENITYDWSVDSNVVNLAPYFTVPQDDKYKCQEMEVVIYVPEGTIVKTSDNAGRIYTRPWDEGKTRRVTRYIDEDGDENLDWEELD